MNAIPYVALILCTSFDDGAAWLRSSHDAKQIPHHVKRKFIASLEDAQKLAIHEDALEHIMFFMTPAFGQHPDKTGIMQALHCPETEQSPTQTGGRIRIVSDGTATGTVVTTSSGEPLRVKAIYLLCDETTNFVPVANVVVDVEQIDVAATTDLDVVDLPEATS